jgi:hypothetical protein
LQSAPKLVLPPGPTHKRRRAFSVSGNKKRCRERADFALSDLSPEKVSVRKKVREETSTLSSTRSDEAQSDEKDSQLVRSATKFSKSVKLSASESKKFRIKKTTEKQSAEATITKEKAVAQKKLRLSQADRMKLIEENRSVFVGLFQGWTLKIFVF